MLYRPNYCNHCGESVERIEWKLWTSRRFCENCETAFRQIDWIPRIGLGLALLLGLFGFGSYLKTPGKPLNLSTNQINGSSANKTQNIKPEQVGTSANEANSIKNNNGATPTNNPIISTVAPKNEKRTLAGNLQNEAAEPVYFCGAQTKKGTPCTRKVKGSGRCWQHLGQPAMLPKEKLVASQ